MTLKGLAYPWDQCSKTNASVCSD